MIIHTVFFKLLPTATAAERLAFERELATLLTSPFIAGGHWGTPAGVEKRPVVDTDWDYATSVQFASLADHDVYQTDDPVHKHFITTCKPLWQSVRVFDIEVP